MNDSQTGVLALEDGSVFRGIAFGAKKTVVGEAVFNTSMTGYQEILTDPSYYGQIITMTAPMIGNYGVNEEDIEADKPMCSGFVVRELSPISSNWRSTATLPEYLEKNGIPGIEGVDTRAITKKLRVSGAMKCCISTEDISDEEAVKRAKEWEGIVGADYVKEVTCKATYVYGAAESSWPYNPVSSVIRQPARQREKFKIAALDLGAKKSIFRELAHHGFEVHVFPATSSVEEIKAINPDGIFLSNGPGDPEPVTYVHETVRALINDYPIFGICLGHQIITHAIGAKTYKLKFGHRGGNQPVKNFETDFVAITAHNHGFATSEEGLEACGAVVTEKNLNDNTIAGIKLKDKPVFSVQYHPEAGPGPSDANPNFEKFYQLVAQSKKA
ncbi:glutamine-hydrolyzing carbamoyl-phosphate synthase small subunit [Pelagicoccus sp. NFK12]|uniref:Carbamoyl phosphate synthase small chain n=1 Tax=Pelagicoccus enzymogenes TaxID=2773457 RepID=A0A927II42_9BACT|nr:glutamine-hydrolyzing carbamoyl-phosphate synthase small subunit [Pelagicoccus enzymogenes]MBD5780358.1 glutamine-hydrolyzing carbamoyl-phosphate synthase small subunit [Pelagicoccus enzymogenes]MDQ8197739.1 glutamine-hydrolyzing carbamoyl-phosphate synthase small subunit [Pelagicoccus enzymogenes]